MANFDERKENYNKISSVPVPKSSGYPNNIASTQTVKKRGTGAATKGTKCSTKLG